jgi:hypothetical protein
MCLTVFPSKIQASHNNNDVDILEEMAHTILDIFNSRKTQELYPT